MNSSKVYTTDDTIISRQKLRRANLHKGRTGKSKEYLNKLAHVGCPIGRSKGKCGCTLQNSKKSFIGKKGRQNKRKMMCDYDYEEIRQVLHDEDEDKKEIEIIKLTR